MPPAPGHVGAILVGVGQQSSERLPGRAPVGVAEVVAAPGDRAVARGRVAAGRLATWTGLAVAAFKKRYSKLSI